MESSGREYILAMDKKLSIFFCIFIILLSSVCQAVEEWEFVDGKSSQGLTQKSIIPPKINESPFYLIGPGDSLNIFVWRNSDLSRSVPVRPDGRISIPLVEDLEVTGKTPTELAREIEKALGLYVKDPIVTVIVGGFLGPYSQQVRVLGEAQKPMALPYREKMTILDLMIAVGGLTEFAAGNRAKIIRIEDGKQIEIVVRLEDLIKDGDINANVDLLPGDILIIPESWF